MMWGGHHFGIGFGWGGWVFVALMVILCIAVITFTIMGIKRLAYYPRNTKSSNLDIVRERYARGEITREQFEELKKDLD